MSTSRTACCTGPPPHSKTRNTFSSATVRSSTSTKPDSPATSVGKRSSECVRKMEPALQPGWQNNDERHRLCAQPDDAAGARSGGVGWILSRRAGDDPAGPVRLHRNEVLALL